MLARALRLVLFAVLSFAALAAARTTVLATTTSSGETVQCVTDGTEGNRIVAVYLYPRGTADRFRDRVPEIRMTINKIDRVWDAAADPFDQHPRWSCYESNSYPRIIRFEGPAIGGDGTYTFTEVTRALSEAGYASQRRVYLVFADNIDAAYPFSGQATVKDDDTASASNRNNTGPGYAMIDGSAKAWSWSAMWYGTMQELGHALGAVQCSAPHASCRPGERGNHHCWDEYDVMCYADGGSYFSGADGVRNTADDRMISVVCARGTTAPTQWDCGKDDYFNIAPPAGSYLATRWNLARSAFATPRRSE